MKSGSQKLKKFLAFVMTAVMVLTAVPLGGLTFSASAENEGYYTYTVENGEATITDCDESISGDVVIPDTLGGYPVTSIGYEAFYNCNGLTSITIPDSVTFIGHGAFEYCTGLTSITIPDSVMSIEYNAFDNTAYYNNSSNWEDDVLYIGNHLIEAKNFISGAYDIKDGTKTIAGNAFSDCTDLTSIIISDSVTSIGEAVFSYCTSLTSITVSLGNTVYHSADNCLIETESKTLVLGCKNSVIPTDGSVTSIGDFAFGGCTGLTSITIPDSVTSIGEGAFSGCTSLTSVTLGNGMTSICNYAFYYCNSLTSITIPDSVTSIGGYAFYGCESLTSITVSSGNKVYHSTDNCLIETESKTLILGCKNSIIPSDGSVTSIGAGAFGCCTGLTSVTIPNSVTSIGVSAFDNCTSLTSVTIPDSVTSIGGYAFYGCESLTSITIPDSVTSIGEWAFCACTSLTSITIPDSVTSIGESAFVNCPSLTSITIPDSVTSIGEGAFESCTGLTSITISDSVTSIGFWTFYGCTGLTSITIPDGVTSIEHQAFDGCTGLTSITIPDSVTSIGGSAFYGCAGLTSVTIPSSVTDIGDKAFGHYYDKSTGEFKKVENFTIYGYTGAAAETYANKNGFVFIDLDEGCSHSFAEQISRQPTCTKDGEKLFTCTQCGYSYSEVMPATGHTDADNDGICDVCGKIIVYTITVGETKTIDIEENEITMIRFVPEESGTYIFESLSDDDTYGYLYDKNYEELCSDNDSGDDFNFSIEYYLEAGEVYYYGAKFLDDANSGSFDVRLEVSDSPEGYYTYTVRYGEATITRCDRSISGDVVIPDTLGGYPVTSIGDSAFYGCESLTSITIPDSVTSIGDYAFALCESLTSITIPDSVTSIGVGAFVYCSGLTSITVSSGNKVYHSTDNCLIETESKTLILGCKNSIIPSDGSVTSIGAGAFGGCTVTSVTIPNSVTSIGRSAFYECKSLTSITIPDSVTSIGEVAFYGCTGLTSITIPDGVTHISYGAFEGCTGLTSITIPDSVTSIGNYAFENCTGLTSITIPDSVTSIGGGTFSGCTGLTSITIPDSVTSIGDKAFYDCTDLTSITIPDSVTSIGSVVFYNTAYYNDDSNWEDDVLYIGNHLIEAKNSISGAYDIKDGTKTIAGNAFYGCESLTSITIPDSVTRIGDSAFSRCTSLTSITIPDSLTRIGDSAFSRCTGLTSITIPDSVTSIGEWAFYGCTGLTSITIPNSVTNIGWRAFYGCTGLTSITIPDSVTSIGSSAFYNCTGLTSITIPSSVTDIGYEAFGYYYDESTYEVKKVENFTIYGYTGTAAETYANENGFAFIALEEEHTHTYSDWAVTTEPTCTAEGEETRTCSVCGATETRPVEKKAHDLFHVEEASTCTVAGVSYDVCDSCGNTFNYTVLPLAAHTFGEWVTTKEATVFESGERKRTCTVCGFAETEEIERLNVAKVKDEKTGISVVYPENSYEGEVEISVTQTFDGASYHVLNAEKGNYQKALFDITTLVDGNKVQPNGSVFVKIPLPGGYSAEKTVVYYITNDGRLEKMDSRVEDGYIVFETTHFSFYAIVDETEKQPENPSANCSCACHKKGIAKLFFKIKLFFQKIFKKNKVCSCGVAHY